ncbi:MAG: outer membrane protein assembly factor BamA [Rhodobacteraceae bacterium]|nr:outer membrane protein assembly factor BamA [Paracoccaceae bacterium]
MGRHSSNVIAAIIKRGWVACLGLIFAVALVAEAQAQSRISNINVEGNRRIETATIISFTGITPGEVVSAGQINAAIQRVRDSGLFESVDAVPSGGTLTIIVVEFPTVNRVAFEGNSRLGDEVLGRIVRSQPRRVYNPTTAEQDAAAITQAYADQGRLAATVMPKIIRRSDNRVDLVYEITEGGIVEVERISFVGNRSFSDRRLRRVLETKQAGLLRFLVQRDTFVEDRIQFDQQVLSDFYQSRGYVDFRTVSVASELSPQRDGFFITFNVVEGQQFRFGKITASSLLDDVDVAPFEAALRLREGAVYTPIAIENNIDRLETLALREGLNFVRVAPRITRNDRDLTLDVEFEITRGSRVFVERIDIEGNTTTLDRVVRRQFKVVEGDPFNPREIRAAAERIRALGYFGATDVNAREGSSPDQVVIDVDVEEQPTGSFSFGGNFSTENGLGLVVEFSERNFLGRGQLLDLSLSTGRDTGLLSFNFVEPGLFDRDLRGGLSFSYRQTDNDDAQYDTEAFNFSPSLGFPVSENGRLTVNAFASRRDLFDVSATAATIIQQEGLRGAESNFGFGYSYSFDNRRSGLNPRAGVVLRFGQEFGFGDTEYIETTALAAAETRILNEDVTLRATLEGGALSYSSGLSRVTDRFFLNSRRFRGFSAQGIGPREIDTATNGDVTNDALGGELFAVLRLDAEFPLGLPEEYGITGGVFFDYGSVWSVGSTPGATGTLLYDDFTPRAVVGVSLFWTSPIGPLRFNFSEAVKKEEFDEEQSFDLTISTRF